MIYEIKTNPGEDIQFSNIQKILGRESTVYFNDGKTPLGVFFDTDHRQYVEFKNIPRNFVNALVASEDNRFFYHWGFDLESIFRAAVKNFQAGRVVQGGSTLTQQTAKNLFKRKDRSFESKLKELFLALELEYYYSKEQIFEFYANQFYVSGNGVGLGIAARYYFDKKPQDLSLVECAFIAGSVKRPNYYNPFRKKTQAGVALAKKRAQTRLGYVLGEMRKLAMIDEETYKKAMATPISFKQGKVGYSLDYTMELVRDAVSSDQVLDALAEHGIDNIAISGVKVITTVDRRLQKQTMKSLRSHLSSLDVMLRDYKRDQVQQELSTLDYSGDSTLEPDSFLFGTISGIEGKGDNVKIDVKLDKNLGTGVIDASGLKTIVTAWARHRRNYRFAGAQKGDIGRFVQQLQTGDRVWVRVVSIPEPSVSSVKDAGNVDQEKTDEEQHTLGDDSSSDEPIAENTHPLSDVPAILELACYPKVQGGAIVVKDGQILAMGGGTENRFFNRAFYARRTMGSAFKPLVYTAALQLGWNSTDLLYNGRSLYVYQGMPYFPRPDHHSPNLWVSMNWAGVHSENLASIWLLSRLCDKLNPSQFREVAEHVGLAPQTINGQEESYRNYSSRIRDKVGIFISQDGLREAAYKMAVKSLEADFAFDGMMREYRSLANLPYGRNFDKFQQDVADDRADAQTAEEKMELNQRKQMLQNSYLRLLDGYNSFASFRDSVTQELSRTLFFEDHTPIFGPLYQGLADRQIYYFPFGGDVTGMVPFSGDVLMKYLDSLGETQRRQFWNSVHIGRTITVEALDMVRQQVNQEYANLTSRRPYDYEILQNIDDFRTAVGLYYLVSLGRELGISSELAPVLSFPLGSNVVTPFEMTRAYETMVKGILHTYGKHQQDKNMWSQRDEDNSDTLAIIDRIEDKDGTVLYQPEHNETQVVDAKTSVEIDSILENVIKYGTGTSAHNDVRYELSRKGKKMEITIPLLGKTGTANNYTNGSFFGYVPAVAQDGMNMTLQGGYAIGVYAGYDNNKEMKSGGIHVSGSAGALPAWSEIAENILKGYDFSSEIDQNNLVRNGFQLLWPQVGDINLLVNKDNGGIPTTPLVYAQANQPSIRTIGSIDNNGQFVPGRFFMPFWLNPSVPQKNVAGDVPTEKNQKMGEEKKAASL